MRPDADLEVEVSGFAVGETDALSLGHAGRDAYVEGPGLAAQLSAAVDDRRLDRDRARCAAHGVLQIDGQFDRASRRRPLDDVLEAKAVRAAHAAEQRVEEIAETSGIESGGGGLPAGRRSEVVAGMPAGTEPVIGRALLLVAQYLVGFADFLEALLGVGFAADVG